MPISPNQGPTSGGTTVTITGVNLINAIFVSFGSNLATITSNTPTSITVISPSGCGVVDVVVKTNGGTSNSLDFFYISPPSFSSMSANSGPTSGGNTVDLFGRYLSTATNVSFGSNNVVPTIISDSQISVAVPAGTSAGTVSVTITTTGGVISGSNYRYVDAPTISTLSPSSGTVDGGTSVTITGTNLSTTSSVTFGGVLASFGVINSNTVVAVTPPGGSTGPVNVTITTTGGNVTETDGYTYSASGGI